MIEVFGELGDLSKLLHPLIDESPESDLAATIFTALLGLIVCLGDTRGDLGECGVRGLKRPCSKDTNFSAFLRNVGLWVLFGSASRCSDPGIRNDSVESLGAGGGGELGEGLGGVLLSWNSRFNRAVLPK